MSELVSNYYENMVFSQLENEPQVQEMSDEGYTADIACVALNQLPSRYIRHPIDASFYITPTERAQMELAVQKAVSDAISFINAHQHDNPDGSASKKAG
ncbi:MAG: late competence development ComFB family protein [Gammaproteobacteria bacterium]|nr:late competence development ComFB family protein [Gammaproteobacteria bacterium]